MSQHAVGSAPKLMHPDSALAVWLTDHLSLWEEYGILGVAHNLLPKTHEISSDRFWAGEYSASEKTDPQHEGRDLDTVRVPLGMDPALNPQLQVVCVTHRSLVD